MKIHSDFQHTCPPIKVVVSSSMPGHSHLPPLSPNIKTVHLQQLPNGSKKKQSSGDFPEFFQLHSEKKKSEGCLNSTKEEAYCQYGIDDTPDKLTTRLDQSR